MRSIFVRAPGWFHWDLERRLLAAIDLVPGESIDHASGTLVSRIPRAPAGTGELRTWPLRIGAGRAGTLRVQCDAPRETAVAAVVSRFHLDLPDAANLAVQVGTAIGSAVPAVRIPAAMSPWTFCLTYLSGGDAGSAFTRRLFMAAGATGEMSPSPQLVARMDASALRDTGVKPSRLDQLRTIANRFLDEPDLDDPDLFRQLDPHDAVDWLRELPRLGPTRALHLAAVAFGHDDVGYDPVSLLGGPASLETSYNLGAIPGAVQRAAPLRSMAADMIAGMILRDRHRDIHPDCPTDGAVSTSLDTS